MKNGMGRLKALVESNGLSQTVVTLTEALESKELTSKDFHWGELVRDFVHSDPNIAKRALEEYVRTGNPVVRTLSETADVSAFNAITGQIVFNEMRVGWELSQNRISAMIPVRQTTLSGERVPGIGLQSKYGFRIHPGEPIPQADFGQHYVQTPSTDKSGLICDVTWEAAFFDRTADLLERARGIGDRLAKNKEKRCCGVLAGVNVTLDNQTFAANNHYWSKGTGTGGAFNTYSTSTQTTSGLSIQANALASTPIVDETALEALAQMSTEMTHPDTGERLNVYDSLNTLIVMPAKRQTVKRFMGADQIRYTTQSSTVNTYGGKDTLPYELTISQDLYGVIIDSGIAAANAKDWYFLCNPAKAFVYMQNRALDVLPAPLFGDTAFQNDLVMRVRALEIGVPVVKDPRYTYKGYNS